MIKFITAAVRYLFPTKRMRMQRQAKNDVKKALVELKHTKPDQSPRR